ncbi:ferritin-like domain-containing protein [Saccharopolyspora sp. 5N708]|uniref:ferritin-like domain-containing protein n=1 Tax=Saccharopolyspora sp. 5N708 TaxID=3457424 RepID=UPI003FD02487
MTTYQAEETLEATPIQELNPEEDIKDVDDLAAHLHVAGQVELSTIPLYLYSAYSIKTKGYSQWAPPQGALRTMIGVAIEEMLHLTLVRNLMLAIDRGHLIRFYKKEFMPTFPSFMLNRTPDLKLDLKRLSTSHVDTFIELEKPDKIETGDILRAQTTKIGQYTSLGAFYRKIWKGFQDVFPERIASWPNANEEYQYSRGFWNQFGAGKPIVVNSLGTAKQALDIIIEQGEGSATDHKMVPKRPDKPVPGHEEFTHYEKFLRIKKNVEGIGAGNAEQDYDFTIDDKDRATWPVLDNPKITDFAQQGKYSSPRVHSLMNLFNATYCYMLCVLDRIFETSTNDMRWGRAPGTDRYELFSHRYGLERNGIAAMQGILYPIAELLARTPVADTGLDDRGTAGPSFEYYEFGKIGAGTRKRELEELCEHAIRWFPELGGEDGVRRQISLLIDIDEEHNG